MKQKTPKILIVAATLIVGLVASASVGLACRNHGMGHGPSDATHLTAEQQQKLDAVREKYSERLDKLHSSLQSKSDEFRKARANDETTVGTLNRIDAERADLKRQYRALLDKANSEADVHASGHQGPWFSCNYDGCNHRNHRGDHSYDRHKGENYKQGMHRGHRNCWW